jgi:hypothetical protein
MEAGPVRAACDGALFAAASISAIANLDLCSVESFILHAAARAAGGRAAPVETAPTKIAPLE